MVVFRAGAAPANEQSDGGELSRPPGESEPTGEGEPQSVTIRWDKGGEEVKLQCNYNDWDTTDMTKGE